jgi:regulator of protease activity HflC (stomatin/prohibitin superfamily)
MLNELWQLVVNSIEFLWPFKIVNQWERALYLVNGHVVVPWRWVACDRDLRTPMTSKELPPGLYLRLPFFTDVHSAAISWNYVESHRLDLTLKDGRTASFEAVAKMRLVDIYGAYVGYYDFDVDIVAAFRAAISETLVTADPERFEPERRGRLLGTSLLQATRAAVAPIGHEVESVQVTTFVLQPKVFRLLQ